MMTSPNNHPPVSVSFDEEQLGPSGAIINVGGELDAAAVLQLRDFLNAAIDRGASPVLLDLSEVAFIDSLSLATVVRAQTRMGSQGRLALVANHPYVLLVLTASGLDSVFEVFETRDDAIAALTEGSGAPGCDAAD